MEEKLARRVQVPLKLLADDYVQVAGGDGSAAANPSCSLNYRLMATAWIAPWGGIVPWLQPATTTLKTDHGTTIYTLRIPPGSRMCHFLGDAALYGIVETQGSQRPRIVGAYLRVGEETIQSLDSETACNISLTYKRGLRLEDAVSFDPAEKSLTFESPLYFEAPLRLLPLAHAAGKPVTIEYEVLGPSLIDPRFFEEVVTSQEEAEMTRAAPDERTIVQHLPSLRTFHPDTAGELTILLSSDMKLARAIYLRVTDLSGADVSNAVATLDVVGPPPTSLSVAMPLPASFYRKHLKKRFGSKDLPYYAIPFAVRPSGNVADYGVLLPTGSQLVITLYPGRNASDLKFEAVVEVFKRIEWKR